MNRINILDCTLRDGGYCNHWDFGYENIEKIIRGLIEADIDVVECGYLTDRVSRNRNISKYTSLEDASALIPRNHEGKLFTVMMNWDEYVPLQLPDRSNTSIDGIRVAFHKGDLQKGLNVCEAVKDKGYKVFIQPMVSLNYEDKEFLELIEKVNKINPYAFYIVDSFGVMKKKNLMHMLYMVEKNLSENIWIGFHSHNNLQMAYANSQSLADMPMNRNLLIDASVYGMGRGSGNLNTELFADYLNENYGRQYKIKPLLGIIDEILNTFYEKESWGYTLPNYLSAVHNIHPNYASFLDAKKTLTVKEMDEIFSAISIEKSISFDRDYIEKKYNLFLNEKTNKGNEGDLRKQLKGKTVLLIAPGKSCLTEKESIKAHAENENVITISVNFNYPEMETDFIFLSNLRRYRELEKNLLKKCIVTTNIPADDAYLKVSYSELVNEEEYVRDNAGLLVINLLIKLGVKKVLLAGFDGYSYDEEENYALQQMTVYRKKKTLKDMNVGFEKVLKYYKQAVDISFLTEQKYIELDDLPE